MRLPLSFSSNASEFKSTNCAMSFAISAAAACVSTFTKPPKYLIILLTRASVALRWRKGLELDERGVGERQRVRQRLLHVGRRLGLTELRDLGFDAGADQVRLLPPFFPVSRACGGSFDAAGVPSGFGAGSSAGVPVKARAP